jgi:sulfate adenylyltransferase
MIRPHGSDSLNPPFVSDPNARRQMLQEAEQLPSLLVNSAAAANAVMIGSGYFNPLDGFMSRADALSVAEAMKTSTGLFFPVPVLNLSANPPPGSKKLALRDPNLPNCPILAIQSLDNIEELGPDDVDFIIQKVFGTLDSKHPGVSAFRSAGRFCISGPIQVLNHSYFELDFPNTFRTASQIRTQIQERGWSKVVAFQTRNPMHRAHEELCRIAKEAVGADGILIHMLLGKLKGGDIPADVRDNAIRRMVELYFPPNTVMIAGYGFDMLYAGPREAVLHALFRQNCGCTHLIVGRDHAGVGSYYGPFDAQSIFDTQVPKGALEIEIFKADHTAWSKKLGKVVMFRDVPDHRPEDFINLSGTKVRDMLAAGQCLPPEFARPEVADVLMKYYQSLT